jgi:hypothetical protein
MFIAKKHFWMSGVWTPVVETIVAKDYPMVYLKSPSDAEQLTSKVSGATIIIVTNDFPLVVKKAGKQEELISKFE